MLATGDVARADEKSVCLASYVDAQARRQDGKLRAAREALLACARESCPARLRADCVTWLAQVEASTPTLAFAARDAAHKDLSLVRVTMDGMPLLARLDGHAVPVDPGEHEFVFVGDGGAAVTVRAVVVEGERHRTIEVTIPPPAAPERAGAPPSPAPPARPVPASVLVAGGAAAAAAGVGAYFLLSGLYGHPGRDELLACRRSCATGDVDAVTRKLVAADVSFALALVAAGVGVVLYLTRPAAGPDRRSAPPLLGASF